MSNDDSSASDLISSPKANAGDHSIFPESSAWSYSFLDRSIPRAQEGFSPLRDPSLPAFYGAIGSLPSQLQNDPSGRRKDSDVILNSTLSAFQNSGLRKEKNKYAKVGRFRPIMYNRLFASAAHSLADAEGKPEPRDLWKETVVPTVSWRPCADQRSWKPSEATNGFVLVSANGGISQQRVAICNAVAIARLLNSTLVIPRFLYSNVWQDTSQFSDLYEEEYFINYLQADIKIVKELPVELQSLDLEAIGSLVTDAEIMKEAKPSFYVHYCMMPACLEHPHINL